MLFDDEEKSTAVSDSVIAEAGKAVKDSVMAVAAIDSTGLDTLTADTVVTPLHDGPDTTRMDSLQLAIYHHNRAIDDSLALDSANRARKNGIDSPVTYSAEDSVVYEAGTGISKERPDIHEHGQQLGACHGS